MRAEHDDLRNGLTAARTQALRNPLLQRAAHCEKSYRHAHLHRVSYAIEAASVVRESSDATVNSLM
jgi:hypothetical protein